MAAMTAGSARARPFSVGGAVIGGGAGIFSVFTLCVIYIFGQADLTGIGALDLIIFVSSLAGGIVGALVGALLGRLVGAAFAVLRRPGAGRTNAPQDAS